jgi:hypothetical protein
MHFFGHTIKGILLCHNEWIFALKNCDKTYAAKNQLEILDIKQNFQIMFHKVVYKVALSSFFAQCDLENSFLLPF